MIYLRNRRGQIAILMLFIVAIVLAIVTLFELFSSDSASPPSSKFSELIVGGQDSFDNIVGMAEIITKESIVGGVPLGLKQKFFDVAVMKHNSLADAQLALYGNFFIKVRDKNTFEFRSIDGGYAFNVTGLTIRALSGNNQEDRNFDLCLLFDKDGNYLKPLANEAMYAQNCAS